MPDQGRLVVDFYCCEKKLVLKLLQGSREIASGENSAWLNELCGEKMVRGGMWEMVLSDKQEVLLGMYSIQDDFKLGLCTSVLTVSSSNFHIFPRSVSLLYSPFPSPSYSSHKLCAFNNGCHLGIFRFLLLRLIWHMICNEMVTDDISVCELRKVEIFGWDDQQL